MAKAAIKELPLEAIRGIAALVVVIWHVCFGFFPDITGIYHTSHSLQGNPLFVFMNGPAAVQLFFVLSAYVLTRRYFEIGDNRLLLRGALKPGPVLWVLCF